MKTFTYSLSLFLVLCTLSCQAKVTDVVGAQNFDNLLASNSTVVVKFGAPWCPACTRSKGPFEKIAQDPEFSTIAFVEIDFDKNSDIAQKYDVQSVPTFLYFKDGKLASRKTGFSDNLKEEIGSTVAGLGGEIKKGEAAAAQLGEAASGAACEGTNFFSRLVTNAKDFLNSVWNTVTGWFK